MILFAFSLPKCLSFTLTECTDVSFQPQLSPRLAAVYLISSPSELLSFFFFVFFLLSLSFVLNISLCHRNEPAPVVMTMGTFIRSDPISGAEQTVE